MRLSGMSFWVSPSWVYLSFKKTFNRFSASLHLKVNELVASHEPASNLVINLEEKTEKEITDLSKEYAEQANQAKEEGEKKLWTIFFLSHIAFPPEFQRRFFIKMDKIKREIEGRFNQTKWLSACMNLCVLCGFVAFFVFLLFCNTTSTKHAWRTYSVIEVAING